MPQRVQLPDGRVVEIPDDATPEQVAAFRAKLSQEFPQAAASQRPQADELGLTEAQRQGARDVGRRFVAAEPKGPIDAATGSLKASLLGTGAGAFEATNALLRREIKSRMGVDDAQAKALADELLGAAYEARPGAYGTGYGLGALGSGGAIAKAPQIASKVAQPLRLAASGAVQAGLTEANVGGSPLDVIKAAGAGAVAAPAIQKGLQQAGKFIDLPNVGKRADAGFRALARLLSRRGTKVAPAELQRRADEFRSVTGRAPTLSQIIGERGGAEVQEIVAKRSPEAVDTLVKGARDTAVRTQEGLAQAITRGREVPAVTKLERLRKVAADQAMSKLGPRTIQFDAASVDELLTDRDVRRALSADAQDALQQLADTGGDVPIRLVEDMRQIFRQRGNKTGGVPRKFREFADSLVEGASEQVPEYGRYLASYGRRSRGIEGAQVGRKAVGTKATEAVEDIAANAPAPFIGGARTGIRAELANRARQSPQSAAQTAKALAEDAGLQRRIAAFDPQEAANLRRVGEVEAQASRNVASTVRGARAQTVSEEDAKAVKEIFDVGVLSTGRYAGGFLSSFALRLSDKFGVPPVAARKLAEAMNDPAKTQEALQKLADYGVSTDKVAAEIASLTSRTAVPAAVQE